MPAKPITALALIACVFQVGCSDLENSKTDDVSDVGASLIVHADLPRGSNTANIAASIYWDGLIRPLVGGDLFVANTGDDQNVALRARENLSGFYQGQLPLTPDQNQVQVSIQFDPQQAREGRWYDTEALVVDTQPGFLVGHRASLVFPVETRLTEPAAETRYRTRADDVVISWQVEDDSHDMRITTLQRCYDGGQSKTWTDTYRSKDTGSMTLNLADLIPSERSINRVDPVDLWFEATFATFMNILTLGLLDIRSETIRNFRIDYCTVDLHLFREVPGTLDDRVEDGKATASTSDSVQVRYEP